jgi:predicted transposase YbfD/YdcC
MTSPAGPRSRAPARGSNRVFAALNPLQFQHCFQAWMEAVRTILPDEVIALDGKTVRGSRDGGKDAIHMVSAWASTNRLVLAQMKVDAKSNEITALPAILQQVAIAGCLVTIDAMGCQRTIAQQILDQGGEYVLGLKGNQGTLEQDVQLSVAAAEEDGFVGIGHDHAETIETGHGRRTVPGSRHLLTGPFASMSDPARRVLRWKLAQFYAFRNQSIDEQIMDAVGKM